MKHLKSTMRKTISTLTIISLLFMSSCGAFRNKTKQLAKFERDSTSVIDSSVKEGSIVVDRSVTTITEKARGTVYTKPEKLTVKSNLSDILAGIKIVRDSGIFKVTQSYDSLTDQINTSID